MSGSDGEYKCPHCPRRFHTETARDAHIASAHVPREYQ